MDEYLQEPVQRRIEALGVPVACWNPDYYYLAWLSYESEQPTDAEVLVLRSYIEFYIQDWYNLTWQEKLHGMWKDETRGIERAFPMDGGCNGIGLTKGGRWGEGWHYRRMSWRDGSIFFPSKYRMEQEGLVYKPYTVTGILDRALTFVDEAPRPKWTAWKKAHPRIFREGQS